MFGSKPDIEQLKQVKDQRALVKALKHKDLGIKWNALLALRSIGDKRLWEQEVDVLLIKYGVQSIGILHTVILNSKSWSERQDAVVILGKLIARWSRNRCWMH